MPQYFLRLLTIYNLTSDVKEFLLLYLFINAAYWQDSYLYPYDGSEMATPCSLNLCLLKLLVDQASFKMFILVLPLV